MQEYIVVSTCETVFLVGSCPYIYPWAFEFNVGKQSKKMKM